jgi:hypothetical protein
MRTFLCCFLTCTLLSSRPSLAQDAEIGGAKQQADIDQSENQVIEKFSEFGSSLEKNAVSAVKREASRDLQLIEGRVTPTPPSISANQNALTEDDDSDAAIEQDIDKLAGQHE